MPPEHTMAEGAASQPPLSLSVPRMGGTHNDTDNLLEENLSNNLETSPLTLQSGRDHVPFGTSSSPPGSDQASLLSPIATTPVSPDIDSSDEENPFPIIPLAVSSMGKAPSKPVYNSAMHLTNDQHVSLSSHPYYSRVYPPSTDMGSLEVLILERPVAESSLYTRQALRNCCYTPCALPCLTAFTAVLTIVFILFLSAAANVADDAALWPIFLFSAAVLLCVVGVYWWLFYYRGIRYVGKPLPRKSALGRTTYDLMHTALANPAASPHTLAQRVQALDAARPVLFLRVEGYVKEQDAIKATLYEGRPHDSSSPLLPLPGFTHHLSVPLRSVANRSAAPAQLEDWYYASAGTSCVSFEYGFELGERDRAWLRKLCRETKHAYTGHEGCKYVRVGVVYALEGVTEPARAGCWQYSYDAEGRFAPLQRAGVNAGLYDWTKVATAKHTAALPDALLLQHEPAAAAKPGCCTRGLSGKFTAAGATLSVWLCMYLPYVCCFRALVRDVTYTHLKQLSLARTAPALGSLEEDALARPTGVVRLTK